QRLRPVLDDGHLPGPLTPAAGVTAAPGRPPPPPGGAPPGGGGGAPGAGPRPAPGGGGPGAAAATAALALVRDPVLGVVVLAAFGVALAAATTSMYALLGAAASAEERPRAFGLNYLLTNAGGAGGAVLAALALAVWPAAAAYPVLYLADAATFAFFAVLIAGQVAPAGTSPARETPAEAAERPGYRMVAADPALRWLVVVTFALVAAGHSQMHASIPVVAAARELPTAGLGWVYAANMAAVVLLAAPVRRLSARWRRTSSLLLAIGLMVAAWMLAQTCGSLGIPALVAAGVVFAGAEVFLAPVLAATVNDLAPPALRGRYNGMHTLAWTAGWLSGTAATAALLAVGATELVFPLLVLVLAFTALAVRPLRRHLPPALDQLPRLGADPGAERGAGLGQPATPPEAAVPPEAVVPAEAAEALEPAAPRETAPRNTAGRVLASHGADGPRTRREAVHP
ncbi:MFS transporter, partial [Frankia sp. CNm7]|uniref:MFS transporter n=1 Tax=Frankia nepalensis TaxID=1836974 RepID=UPI0019323954